MGIGIPHEYQPSEDEEFMNPTQVEYFRRRLEQLRADLRQELNAIPPPEAHDITQEGDQTDHASAALERRNLRSPEPRTDPEIVAASRTSAFKA